MAAPEVQAVGASAADAAWLGRVLGALGVDLAAGTPDVDRPTLLCVRDVRDIHARRLEDVALVDAIRALGEPGPGPFGLPPAETWALELLVWIALADGTDVAVIRMEDLRAEPAAEVARVLAALGIAADGASVAAAVGGAGPPPAAAWRPAGWDRLPAFHGPAALALATLGYDGAAAPLAPERRPPGGLAPALAAVKTCLGAGDQASAYEAIVEARAVYADDPATALALAAARVALDWTAALVGAPRLASPQAGRAFEALLLLALRFAAIPSFDATLFAAETATRSAAERRDPARLRAARLQASGDSPCTRAETADLFAAGNYTAVARVGSFDAWQTYAALGLIGRTELALDALERATDPEARFWAGVVRFVAGDDAGALAVLDAVPGEYARRLAALVRKPTIRVLAQVPWVRQGTQDYLSSTGPGRRFEVRNISFDERDVQNRPYAAVADFVDPGAPPDFFFAAMAEFHMLPPDLRSLDCPLLAQTSDYDLYVQTLYPRLAEFDEVVVSDQTEWAGVRGLVSAPVSSFAACLGVPDHLPPLPTADRPVDVAFSGASIHPVYPEKARALRDLLDLPDATVRVVNGYPWYRAYLDFLARCKVTFTNIRRPGCVPSRGLEAIGMGCALVVQRESTLTLFLGEEDGLATYDDDARDLTPAVARILAEWDVYAQRARWGARIARRELGMTAVADRFLRFLTVLAARPRPARVEVALVPGWERSPLVQRRGCLWRGPDVLPAGAGANLLNTNLARWSAEGDGRAVTLGHVARELVLEHASGRTDAASPLRERLLTQGLALYWDAVDRHPDRLALRFNLIRSALHFGQPREVTAALRLAVETLAIPPGRWRVQPSDDVLPHDFAPGFFHFRAYTALLVDGVRTGLAAEPALVRLMLAAIHHYVGWYGSDPEQFAHAAALDPDFAPYRLSLVRVLLERRAPGDLEQALPLLAALADGTVVFPEALELVEVLRSEGVALGPEFDPVHAAVGRYETAVGHHENLRLGTLRPAYLPDLASGRGLAEGRA